MTDDRTLLDRAAKAAGITLPHWMSDGSDDYWLREWNPLTDDGDALRLAVKLGMSIKTLGRMSSAFVPSGHHYGEDEEHGSDPYAATRRAIVRAAAAMDKGE